jgi:hypothetical protein
MKKCPKGPANMSRNQITRNPENPTQFIKVIGFTGFPGFRYHPTKGFRREAGYNPLTNKVIVS